MTDRPQPQDRPDPQDRKGRKDRPAHTATVRSKEVLSPHLIRVAVHSEAVSSGEVAPNDCTDVYLKLALPDADGDPVLRTYTIRNWRVEAGEFDLDMVVHGDEGLAGPWARNVQVGETVTFRGPGGGYAPPTGDVTHLLVGDLSALPAIEAALEVLPAGANGQVVVVVEDEADVRPLPGPLPVEWIVDPDLVRGYARATEYVVQWQALGPIAPFVHGEAGFVRGLRRHLRVDRGLSAKEMSISGYWKFGLDDAGWRQDKRAWLQPVDEQEAALAEGQ
ncbi:siderophore-interacting protein [Propionibacteriaceae bacterium Y2011]|uniref:siderophore-interacting protein n=1 Tax=Microlunatus sp. Y2014 TaxID=3418488 RepID=UPI003B4DCDC1